jgi:protein phosphatase
MPIAAIVNDSIFCVHGGIGSTLVNVNEIAVIPKPIKVNHEPKTKTEKIIYDLLWSDPCKGREPAGTVNQ